MWAIPVNGLQHMGPSATEWFDFSPIPGLMLCIFMPSNRMQLCQALNRVNSYDYIVPPPIIATAVATWKNPGFER